jgi:hypothetical protein
MNSCKERVDLRKWPDHDRAVDTSSLLPNIWSPPDLQAKRSLPQAHSVERLALLQDRTVRRFQQRML